MERELKEIWKATPSDVQVIYGWEYVNTQIQGSRRAGVEGCPTTQPVTDAMIDALVSTQPKCRYLVPGGSGWYDIWAVSMANSKSRLNQVPMCFYAQLS